MNTLLIKTIFQKVALAAVCRKINENPDDKQGSDFCKKEAVKAVPIWMVIAGLIYTAISSPEFIAAFGG